MQKRLLYIVSILIFLFAINTDNSKANNSSIAALTKVQNQDLINCGFRSTCILDLLEGDSGSLSQLKANEQIYFKFIINSNAGKVNCHTVTHLLGEWSYRRYKISAFLPNDNNCLGGYTHGFLIAMSHNYKNLNVAYANMNKLCMSETNSNSMNQCFHGIGHSLVYTSKNLRNSLLLCSSNKKEDLSSICIDGAAMEYVNSVLKKEVNINSLVSLCEIFKNNKTYSRECLSQILQYKNQSYDKIFSLSRSCIKFIGSVKDGCEEALGYVVANSNYSVLKNNINIFPLLIKSYCDKNNSYWCINALASRTLTLTFNANQLIKSCNDLLPKETNICRFSLKKVQKFMSE